MKNKKLFTKFLSVFLATLIVIGILPLSTMAQSFTDYKNAQQALEELLNNPVKNTEDSTATIIGEVEEKRDEYTKVYKKDDGSYTAIMSKEPLHYLEDGVWQEIDSSMILQGGLYTNTSNNFNVEFPKDIDSNESLTVENDGHSISFSVDNIDESSAVVENNIVESDTNIPEADTAIAQTQSAVTYNDVAENTDLQYIVTPNSIKENIIVADKESVQSTYSFTFETNGLNTVKQDDGSVVFKDNSNNVKFRIPRPVMTDNSLAFSYDIAVSLTENADDTVTLIYTPSTEWVNDANRVYPIVIDPAIQIESDTIDWIEDTYVADISSDDTVQNTNYSDVDGGIIADYSEIKNGVVETTYAEIYTKINTDVLESLSSNLVITEAHYLLVSASMNGKALAKEIAEPIDFDTVTYNTKPTLDDEVIDYYTSPYVSEAESFLLTHFNITKPLNDWLNGEENNGFAMVAGNEGFLGIYMLNGLANDGTPKGTTYLIIDYVDLAGYDESLNYHSQEVGRAGTGYVNDFTQSLSVVRNDLSIDGNIMPVTIGMMYNTATYNQIKNMEFDPMLAYGNGWLPNYMRAYVKIDDTHFTYYTENGVAIDYVGSLDEDGNIVIEEAYSDIYGNYGYEFEYIPESDTQSETIIVTRPDGYIEKFNSDGLLVSVSNPDYDEQKISIVYTNSVTGYPVINYVTDGVGRKYDFVYDSTTKLLSKVKCYNSDDTEILAGSTTSPLEVNYTYTNGYLTSVTYPDGKSILYTYDTNGNMTSIENIDGYRVVYEYENNRVKTITEQALDGTTYVDGGAITYFCLSPNQIMLIEGKFEDIDDIDEIIENEIFEIYQFNANGKLLYTTDSRGNYFASEEAKGANNSYYIIASDYNVHSENLLKNPTFNDESNWSGINTAFSVESGVLKAEKTTNGTTYKKQTVNILSGGNYTLSAYVKSEAADGEQLTLRITAINGSNVETETKTVTVGNTGNEWQRYTTTINVASNIKKISVEIGFANSKGTFYIDDVQLEQSETASNFNLINNGGFRFDSDDWENASNLTITDANINNKASKAIVIPNDTIGENTVYQLVSIDGKKDDVYNIGGWMKAPFVKSSTNNEFLNSVIADQGTTPTVNFTNDRFAQIEVSYQYIETDEEGVEQTLTDTISVPFAEHLDDWQFALNNFVLKGDTDELKVILRYENNLQDGMFSNIELSKDEDAVVVEDEEETTEENEGCTCGNCEESNCACTCESEALCTCITCKRRSDTSSNDTFGNITSSSSFDGVKSIQALSSYTSDGNYIATETDADGNTVSYNYNQLNGLLNAITDARANTTSYTYDASGALTQVSSSNSSVSYSYSNDKLTAITHNGFSYNLSYDIWGQLTQVSIGTQPIISYSYGEGQYRDRVIASTYHNGNFDNSNTTTEYYYNSYDDITKIVVNDSIQYEYGYDSFGSLTEISEDGVRTVKYTDDRIDILDPNNNYIYSSYSNDDGDSIEIIGDLTYISKSYESEYDAQSGNTVEKSDVAISNGKIIGTVSEQDWFGRYTESVVKTESAEDTNTENTFAAVKTEYTYLEYDGNKTSNHVDKYVNKVYNSTNTDGNYKSYTGYTYDYDGNGNITAEYSINAGGTEALRFGYIYDELNQLIRVNDAVSQKTYTYTYDNAGNILSKTSYPFTTSELGTANETINYTYDGTWKDKLTSYGSNTITYDNIGNPLTIGNKTFTWEGRQLKSCAYYDADNENNVQIDFEYDENGLRHRKTVKRDDVLTEKYDYVWSDGKLISQTYTTYEDGEVVSIDSAKFIYNDWGELQGLTLNNDKTYLYTKNLQGDITSIVNESGNTIITYTYDSWGAVDFHPTSVSNMHLAYTLYYVSPFAYRGYCYDDDMVLYYLQSRYYSPEMGRFINTDDTQIAIATQGEVLGANLFAYCNNNPVNYVDYSGYAKIKISWISTTIDLLLIVIPAVFQINKALAASGRVSNKILLKFSNLIENNMKKIKDFVTKGLQKIYEKCFAIRIASIVCPAILKGLAMFSILSSIGAFIQYMIDCLDGKWDGFLDTSKKLKVQIIFSRS